MDNIYKVLETLKNVEEEKDDKIENAEVVSEAKGGPFQTREKAEADARSEIGGGDEGTNYRIEKKDDGYYWDEKINESNLYHILDTLYYKVSEEQLNEGPEDLIANLKDRRKTFRQAAADSGLADKSMKTPQQTAQAPQQPEKKDKGWFSSLFDDVVSENNDQLTDNVAARIIRYLERENPDVFKQHGSEYVYDIAHQNAHDLCYDWPEGEGFGSSDAYGAIQGTLRDLGLNEEGTRVQQMGTKTVVNTQDGDRHEFDDPAMAQEFIAQKDMMDSKDMSKLNDKFEKVMENLNEDITVTQMDPQNPEGDTVTVTSNVNNIDALQGLLSNAGLGNAASMEPYAPEIDPGMDAELDGGPVMGMGGNDLAGPTDLPAMDEPVGDEMGGDDMSTFMSIVDKGMEEPDMDMEPEVDIEPPMEERDIEHANTPDEKLGTTDTLVNKLSGGLNGPKDMPYAPANGGDNPRAGKRVYEDSEDADVLRGLNDLYQKYKG